MENRKFGLLSDICVDQSESYSDKIFLTLDVDWAHDQIILDTVSLFEKHNVKATWFVTHETEVIDVLRANDHFELGIHPNFNALLEGDLSKGRNAEEIIDNLLEIVPEAKSVRSHSMAQSFRLLDLFSRKGLTHDSNDFIPEQSNVHLVPFCHWSGLTRIPFFWEDNVQIMYEENSSIDALCRRPGLKVFNFHPIHIYMNTESLDRYENTRAFHYEPEKLYKLRNNQSDGAMTILENIIS